METALRSVEANDYRELPRYGDRQAILIFDTQRAAFARDTRADTANRKRGASARARMRGGSFIRFVFAAAELAPSCVTSH